MIGKLLTTNPMFSKHSTSKILVCLLSVCSCFSLITVLDLEADFMKNVKMLVPQMQCMHNCNSLVKNIFEAL